MSLTEILALPSVDSDGIWADVEGAENRTVANAVKYKKLWRPRYWRIAWQMHRDGVNTVPVHVGRATDLRRRYEVKRPADIPPDSMMAGNGHHRIKLAMRLHHTVMLVTDNIYESAGIDDHEYGCLHPGSEAA